MTVKKEKSAEEAVTSEALAVIDSTLYSRIPELLNPDELCAEFNMPLRFRRLFTPPLFLVNLPLHMTDAQGNVVYETYQEHNSSGEVALDKNGNPRMRNKLDAQGNRIPLERVGAAELKDDLIALHQAFIVELFMEVRSRKLTVMDYLMVERAATQYVTMRLREVLPSYPAEVYTITGSKSKVVPAANVYRTWDTHAAEKAYASMWLDLMVRIRFDIYGKDSSEPKNTSGVNPKGTKA